MSLNRYAVKRDRSEGVIVEYLKVCGAMVVRISGRDTPDLLVGIYGRWTLIECKTGSKGLTPGQEVFVERAKAKGLPVHVLRTLEDAEDLILQMGRLT